MSIQFPPERARLFDFHRVAAVAFHKSSRRRPACRADHQSNPRCRRAVPLDSRSCPRSRRARTVSTPFGLGRRFTSVRLIATSSADPVRLAALFFTRPSAIGPDSGAVVGAGAPRATYHRGIVFVDSARGAMIPDTKDIKTRPNVKFLFVF